MKQIIHPFLIFLLLFSALSARNNRNERFFRVLKKYQDPNYKAKDRDAYLNFGYWSRYEKDQNTEGLGLSEMYDIEEDFIRNMDLDVGIDIERLGGDSLRSRKFDLDAKIEGEYKYNSEKVHNELIGKSNIWEDEEKKLALDLDSDLRFTKYKIAFLSEGKREAHLKKKKREIKRDRYISLSLSVDADAKLLHEKDYRQKDIDFILLTADSTRTFESSILGNAKLMLGWGRKYPFTPVFRAFQIERAMLESGAISSPLSDNTLIRIAQWLARESDHSLRHDRSDKFFYAQLDSIIAQDSSLSDIKLNGYSYNYIRETVMIPYPFLKRGFQFYFKLNQSAIISFYHDFNDPDDHHGDFSFDWFQDPYLFSANIDLVYPLTSKLFLATTFEQGYLTKAENDHGGMSYDPVGIEYVFITFHYDLDLLYWLNDRILFNIGVKDVRGLTIIPTRIPKRISSGITFFIADKISLELKASKYSDTKSSKTFDFNPSYSDEIINLGIRYDF